MAFKKAVKSVLRGVYNTWREVNLCPIKCVRITMPTV